jgi:hypothetical protein
MVTRVPTFKPGHDWITARRNWPPWLKPNALKPLARERSFCNWAQTEAICVGTWPMKVAERSEEPEVESAMMWVEEAG